MDSSTQSLNNLPEDASSRWTMLATMAQDGQKNAYNMLLNEIGPYIRSTILPTLSNPDWADDITQNVLISVHKSLSTYSASRPFIPWLRAIIKFRRYDYLRKFYSKKELKKTSLDNPDFLNHHVTNPAMTDEYIDIERALDTLPVKQSSVFKKLKIEGRSINEVADEMGMSESAVKVSAHRTIKKLQDILR